MSFSTSDFIPNSLELASVNSVMSFGAKGDGVTNNVTPINAAISHAISTSLGTVDFTKTASPYNLAVYNNDGTPVLPIYGNLIISGNGATIAQVGSGPIFENIPNIAYTKNITGNVALNDQTLMVTNTTGLTVGQIVLVALGYATYDANEPASWYFATITSIPSSTTVTLDTGADFAFSLGVNANNFVPKITVFNTLVEDFHIEGFHLTCAAIDNQNIKMTTGINVTNGRRITVRDVTGFNVGNGLVSGQYVEGYFIDNAHVLQSVEQYSQLSSGRGFGFAECRSVVLNGCSAENCANQFLIAESNCDVTANTFRIKNTLAGRTGDTTNALISCLGNSRIRINDLTVEGFECLVYSDSGTAGCSCNIHNSIFKTSGLPRILDMSILSGSICFNGVYEGHVYGTITTRVFTFTYADGATTINLPTGIYRQMWLTFTEVAGLVGGGLYIPSYTGGGNRMDSNNGSNPTANVEYRVPVIGMGPSGSGFQINSGPSSRSGTLYWSHAEAIAANSGAASTQTMTVVLEYWPGA